VIELAGEQMFALLGLALLGDVSRNSDDADHFTFAVA
jgi:hypothetical protein